MVADPLTKPLSQELFSKHVRDMGLQFIDWNVLAKWEMLDFLYVAFNIYSYYLYYGYYLPQCGIIYWCVWWGIINVEFNSWNLYSSCRGHLCWNTVEKLIEIDSTRIFIMYVHVWPGYSVMEMMGLFAGSVLQVISPHDQIRIDPYIQLIIAHDSHMCAWNYYILDS